MPTIITTDLLKAYFTEGAKTEIYKQTVKLEKDIRVHADGIIPEEIIGAQRPSEPKNVMDYRKAIWQAITKEVFSRICTCLSKIRRSADWSVMYDEATFIKRIVDSETPKQYFEKKYPYFETLTNWLFSVCLREYLIDANAVCVVMPLELPGNDIIKSTDYLRPFPFIFNSHQVIAYSDADYCVLKSNEKAVYYGPSGAKYADGKVFWVVTSTYISKHEQINSEGDIARKEYYEHNLGYMPAFKLGGVYIKTIDYTPLWVSRINAIVPRLNKAAREDNDLDVTYVRNMFLEKWEYVSVECKTCKGIGELPGEKGNVTCSSCNGFGRTVSSPMQSHLIIPAKLDEQQMPTPPAGYISKPTEIVELMERRIEAHITKALASINMEFLSKTPMSESGIAKEVDRDELNTFVYSISEDLVRIMDKIYYISFDYRYKVVVPIDKERYAMLPKVNVPEKYDMLSVNYLIDEYIKSKNAKMNPILINKMEQEIATKKFSTDPEMAEEINAILKLNPFSGVSADDLMGYIQNRFITNSDAVIAANIVQFVRRAVFEYKAFYAMSLPDQQAIMRNYANEKIEQMSAASALRTANV